MPKTALEFPRCRICRRVAWAVFLGIVVIEAAILIPSYVNYERDRLGGIEETGREVLRSTLDPAQPLDEQRSRLEALPAASSVKGGEIRAPGNGAVMLRFGDEVDGDAARPPDDLRAARRASEGGEWMEVRWGENVLQGPWSVVARLDTSYVGDELQAFVWRIAGLVLLIAGFVTVVTLVVVQWLLLGPLLRLRERMARIGSAPQNPLAFVRESHRQDELGELERAFNDLLRNSQRNLDAIAARERELHALNQKLDRRVAERTQELNERNRALEAEIEQRKSAEARARSLARFPDENTNPVLRVSAEGTILYANTASGRLLRHWDVDPAKSDARLPEAWADVVAGALRSGEGTQLEVQCDDQWFSLALTPITEEEYVNIYATDITERKAYEEALLRRQTRDEVTDLPNLAVFQDRVQQALRNAASGRVTGAVVVVGLDGFREINGVAGHAAGDAVLRTVAERLRSYVGPNRTVGRLAGDTFGVIVAETHDFNELAAWTEAMLTIVSQPLEWQGRELIWGASAGIALLPGDGETPEDLLRNADLALSGAKGNAQHRVRFFVTEMNRAVEHRNRRLQELRRALTNGEFELHYQPQVHAADGALIGHEALIRWRHPAEGLVSPGEFIPLAEESGLIEELGQWTLWEACRRTAARNAAGLPASRVAVNLSAVQLSNPELPERVARLLHEHGLPAEQLELEVTESAVMDDIDTAVRLLTALRRQGVQLALDDFGTGHSSLAYLKRFPVQRVKIDRAFVKELPDNHQDRAFCEAIIALSWSLALEPLAEGVEDGAQAALLGELGCRELQGFYFGRPEIDGIASSSDTQYEP